MKLLIKFSVIPVFLLILLIAGCSQQENSPVDLMNSKSIDQTTNSDGFSLGKYSDLPQATLLELQQAKIATARYHNINNAIADGYEDINVIVPHMGYHYLNAGYLDGTFEADKPELLVYSPNPGNGNMRLVAVEYAVPVSLSQDPPEGFTGSYDTWDFNAEFQLWTLHAWVWYYNPDGIFTDLNPRVP
jgi:hypothetical protein